MNKKIAIFTITAFSLVLTGSLALAASNLTYKTAFAQIKSVFGNKANKLDSDGNTGSSGILKALTNNCLSTTTVAGLNLADKSAITTKLQGLKNTIWPALSVGMCSSTNDKDRAGFKAAYNARLSEACEGVVTLANKTAWSAYSADLNSYRNSTTTLPAPTGTLVAVGTQASPGLNKSLKNCEESRVACVKAAKTNTAINQSLLRTKLEMEDCKITKDVCNATAYLIYNLRIKQSFTTKTLAVDGILGTCMANVINK